MTLTPNKPETTPITEAQQEFNWRNYWYPVTFTQDLPKNRPYGFTLYDEALVLFRNSEGQLVCLRDLCPHRAAKLSDGQIIDGKIECLYHGWQFGSEGECLHIPQLPEDAKIPANSCVKSYQVVECQGMIWMWAGESKDASEELIPTLPDLDKPEFVRQDFILDLPYDRTYLFENLTDPAHVPISHHGTRGGGDRKNAQPLEMEILESSIQGIRARYRGMRKANPNWGNISFVAPNLVVFSSYIEERGWSFGLALYSIPMGQGRCRLLSRGYRNFLTWGVKLRPRWLDHLNTNKILEQDLPLIAGQQAQIERIGQTLEELYLPLKTSDLLVVEYRKWLDKFGSSLPYYQGYSTSKVAENNADRPSQLPTRADRHLKICSSCNRAYKVTNRVKQISIGVAIALFALATLADESKIKIVAVSISLLAIATA
ncbi:MAG: Rieske 2Fe-2S domain-containing protein, partial [Prochloraceae cyanobacterium]|nr:Rieske 2Fe-2S domain-containing protein [Prochloraceae cyanobacterium]